MATFFEQDFFTGNPFGVIVGNPSTWTFVSGRTVSSARLLLSIPLVQLHAAQYKRAVLASAPPAGFGD